VSFERAASWLGIASLVTAPALVGCTIRYSQALVGEIQRPMPGPVQNADSGTAFGLLGPRAVWTLHEPMSAEALQSLPCDVALAEVDYRAKWFGIPLWYVYPSASFPAVRVISYCSIPPPADPADDAPPAPARP
jgi:hypothetical protein